MQFGQFGEFYAWHMHWIQIGSFNTPCHALCNTFTPLSSPRTLTPHLLHHSATISPTNSPMPWVLMLASLFCRNPHALPFKMNTCLHFTFVPSTHISEIENPSLHTLALLILHLLRSNLGSKSEKLLHPFPIRIAFKKSERDLHFIPFETYIPYQHSI